jgi:hypothetical protein
MHRFIEPAKKSTDENMETGIGVNVIIELIDIPMDVVGLGKIFLFLLIGCFKFV